MDWVPEGHTLNQVDCKEVLTNLREQMRRRLEMWKTLLMGSSRQCTGTQRPVCQDVFDEAQDHRVGTSTVLT